MLSRSRGRTCDALIGATVVRTVPLDQAREALLEHGDLIPDLPRELQVMVKLQKVEHPQQAGDIDVVLPSNAARAVPAVTFEWLWSGDPAQAGKAAELLGLGGRGQAHTARKVFVKSSPNKITTTPTVGAITSNQVTSETD